MLSVRRILLLGGAELCCRAAREIQLLTLKKNGAGMDLFKDIIQVIETLLDGYYWSEGVKTFALCSHCLKVGLGECSSRYSLKDVGKHLFYYFLTVTATCTSIQPQWCGKCQLQERINQLGFSGCL